jgi:tripartite-type tricarboxylate transporter receptor subunit TctC
MRMPVPVCALLLLVGADPPVLGMTPEAFNAIVRSDTETWRKVVRDLKLDLN